jgi:L-asparaginase / beta-aspartyl-peptidase
MMADRHGFRGIVNDPAPTGRDSLSWSSHGPLGLGLESRATVSQAFGLGCRIRPRWGHWHCLPRSVMVSMMRPSLATSLGCVLVLLVLLGAFDAACAGPPPAASANGAANAEPADAKSEPAPPDAPAGKPEYALVIHGGAGRLPPSPELRENRKKVLDEALTTGTAMLSEGKSSLETVEAVVRILEDSPDFNAGKGAVFNSAGTHELDASIMDGRTHACGGVGGVRTVKNPISLARLVMTETPHVLLVSDGAEAFADAFSPEQGIERVSNDFFSTERQIRRLRRDREQDRSNGTVGCVAFDKQGNLAAATSTGGLADKKFGRVGDSPIIAAGTYADNATCGVSATGVGEDFIRYAVCYDVSARMRYKEESLEEAMRAVLHHPERTVRGGLIGIDSQGRISMQFNTPGMSRAAADSTGLRIVRVAE